MGIEYTIIRSNRKTIALEARPDGLLVRAPSTMSDGQIAVFVAKHRDWIDKHLEIMRNRQQAAQSVQRLTMDEIRELADKALTVIPERARYYAQKLGVTYGGITVRNQNTRWGSCSGKGNLNFNCLLMLTPPEVIDSVVVHELCHLKEPNHSSRFYDLVLSVYPDYWLWDNWLKENGASIIRRMTGK